MGAPVFAAVLRERLGHDGYDAFMEALRVSQQQFLTTERFEQRLAEEMGKVRAEMSGLRTELREELHQLRADIRIDIAERGAELMKWAMFFWVGQGAAVAGIVVALR